MEVSDAQEPHIVSPDTCTPVKPSPKRDNKRLHQPQKFPKSPDFMFPSYST